MYSFKPKNLYVKSDINSPYKGAVKQVRYCAVSEEKEGKAIIEQYYDKNFAKAERVCIEEVKKIDGYENRTNKNVELYKLCF
jgi:hypothetical protein